MKPVPPVKDNPVPFGTAGNRVLVCRLRHWSLATIACTILMLSQYARSAESSLTFGVFPYLTPQLLIAHFTPLRDYLQQTAGRPVSILSAPNYAIFNDRTLAGDYDIVFTAPHLGNVAETGSGYQRIAMTRYRVKGVVLVRKDSPVKQLSDLRGKVVAVPPSRALIYMLTAELFRSKGLVPDRDIIFRKLDSNENSMVAPLRSDSDAGVTGVLVWSAYSRQDRMRVVAETPDAPGFVMMAHPRMAAAMLERLRKATYAFGNTPVGKAYFAATGHGAWLPIDDVTMRSLNPYARYAKE